MVQKNHVNCESGVSKHHPERAGPQVRVEYTVWEDASTEATIVETFMANLRNGRFKQFLLDIKICQPHTLEDVVNFGQQIIEQERHWIGMMTGL